MVFLIFHSVEKGPFAVRPWEYTNRVCFPVRPLRAAPDGELAKGCEYCSACTGRFRELRSDRSAAETIAATVCSRGQVVHRSRSTPGRTHRAVRGKCGAAWTPGYGLISARARCVARREVRGERKSCGWSE